MQESEGEVTLQAPFLNARCKTLWPFVRRGR